MRRLFICICLFCLLGVGNSCAQRFDGIDVSHYQGKIDWQKVAKNKNIRFVYIKATEGKTTTDKTYKYNNANARAAGLKVGAYHYFRSTSGAREQFFHFMKVAPVETQDLVPMLDVEDYGVKGWTRKQVQDSVRVWIALCKKYYGKAPIIYGTQRSYNTWLAPDFNNYHLYIGRYGKNEPVINGTGRYSIWQFSEKGVLSGIEKPVDLARFRDGVSINDLLLKKKK